MERSRDFYGRIPGVRLLAHRPCEFALFEVGAGLLGLLQLKAPGFHLEIDASDLDAMHAQLEKAGVKTSGRPRQRPWGERTFNVTDPDGYVLEFQDG